MARRRGRRGGYDLRERTDSPGHATRALTPTQTVRPEQVNGPPITALEVMDAILRMGESDRFADELA